MTDEHNPFVSEPFGHPFIQTPNIQRLANRGVLFENAYCNSPLCVPSRASFMTGKYVNRIGVWDNAASLSSNEPTWAADERRGLEERRQQRDAADGDPGPGDLA